MAIVSRAEFAELCRMDVKALNVYISRKKIILHDGGGKTIDTENMINMLFKKTRLELQKLKTEEKKVLESIPANPRTGKSFDDDDEEPLPPPIDKNFITEAIKAGGDEGVSGENMQSWIRKKMKGDADLVALRVEKEQLLLDKAAGRLIPIDVASNILRSQARSIFANMENAIENIASIYCNVMASGNMEMYARILEEGQKQLAISIERAGADASNDLEIILNEYSDSRATKL